MKSYFRDRHQCVEANIKMSIAMHFYAGVLQKTVFHEDQFKVSYIFFYLHKWLLKNYSWKIQTTVTCKWYWLIFTNYNLKIFKNIIKKEFESLKNCSKPIDWPRSLRRGCAVTRLLELWVRIPPGAWKRVWGEGYVLSGGGLSTGLTTRPEEYYR